MDPAALDDIPEWLQGFPGFDSDISDLRDQIVDAAPCSLLAVFITPEVIERRNEAIRTTWASKCKKTHAERVRHGYAKRDPEANRKHRENQAAALQVIGKDPEFRRRCSEGAKRGWIKRKAKATGK
jgi:hypothetical protein